VRICDIGGWTDTWFARHGAVFSIAVSPRVIVEVVATTPAGGRPPAVAVDAPDLHERYRYERGAEPGRQPFLEQAVAFGAPEEPLDLAVTIRAGVPAGSGTGTSGALLVALLATLDRVAGAPSWPKPLDVARAAHRCETEAMGLQSGVQDHLAAAVGGINMFEIGEYPSFEVAPSATSPEFAASLDARLLLVTLGRPHASSLVHEQVIARLTAGDDAPLDALRAAAHAAHDAAALGDLAALAAALRANDAAQRALHPELVSADADRIFDVARRHGAIGWKVNGAGGDGGSVTLLAGDGGRVALADAIRALPGSHAVVQTEIASTGVDVVSVRAERP
jgi:D-glycero-alpha-D-manno-heptose-7-phosphate kinase